MSRAARVGWLVAMLLALGPGFAATASADGATCTLFEISARRADKPSMDSSLAPLASKLGRPPLSSWNVFALLTRLNETFAVMQSQTFKLKRSTANIVLREIQTTSKKRYSFSVAVDDERRKRVVDTKYSIDAGDYVVIGRSVGADEGLLLAIGACR